MFENKKTYANFISKWVVSAIIRMSSDLKVNDKVFLFADFGMHAFILYNNIDILLSVHSDV